ncbi:MAG: hypothetical protein IPP98_09320 [Gemmatimonadetes bacterium]|nr:hypothetical protein [Gemmatimonadota bacterium]
MRLSMLPFLVLLATTPLAAQDNITPNGSRITTPGVTRASATVDSVFVEKRSTQGRVDVGDFTAYLLARLGVPPFSDSLAFLVTSDSSRIRIRGRLMDFPPEARAELGPIFSFVDSTSSFMAELSMPQRDNGVMRFRLERLLVRDIALPEFLFLPALAEYARRYPVLTAGGREFLVAMPAEARVGIGANVLELVMPKKKS